MARIACPIEDCDGDVIVEESQDSQGVDGWAQSYTYVEIIEITCGHELSDEQEQKIISDYVPDYSWLEQ